MADTSKLIEHAVNFLTDEMQEELADRFMKHKDHIVLDFLRLATYNPDLATRLLDHPAETLKIFQIAATKMVGCKTDRFNFRVMNLPKAEKLPIGRVRTNMIGKFKTIEGVVRQKGDVKFQLVMLKFACLSCGEITPVLQTTDKIKKPKICKYCGQKSGRWRELPRTSGQEMIDAYKLLVEEDPEFVNQSKIANIHVLCETDLTNTTVYNKFGAGSKVRITGWVNTFNGDKTALDHYFYANHIEVIGDSFEEINYDDEEKREIINWVNKQENPVHALKDKIFPAVYGFDKEKEGIILQMFGGCQKTTNMSRARGDIHVLLVGEPGCLRADSLVFMADGTCKRVQDVKKGGRAVLVDRRGSADNPYGTITDDFEFSQQKTKIITLATGKTLTVSHPHPLWVRDEKKTGKFGKRDFTKRWVRADKLHVGDKVKVLRKVANKKKKLVPITQEPIIRSGVKHCKMPSFIDETLAWCWGYIIADGTIRRQKGKGYAVSVVFNPEEDDARRLFAKDFKELFGKQPTVYHRKPVPGMIGDRVINRTQTITALTYASVELATLFDMNKQPTRKVPDEILSSPRPVVAAFLKGLFEGDGCVIWSNGSDRKKKGRVELKSSSERLLQDVQTLLLQFGIVARKYVDSVKIARQQDVITFAEQIGFVSTKKKSKLSAVCKEAKTFERGQRAKSYEPIVSIEEGPLTDVYDMTVKDAHRYVSEGVISHNTSKSQLLKIVHNIMPKSRYTAGTGVSGVGLTASVVKDELLGGWVLEPGILPLTHKGFLCLDELDKATPEDRNSLHEALEQQSVSISKANISATLQCETTVLAAANPKHGVYDDYQGIFTQIDLAASLINRFDLIFIMKSNQSPEQYKEIINTMMGRWHEESPQEKEITPEEILFLKKYVSFAKTLHPIISPDKNEFIFDLFMKIKNARDNSEEKHKFPVSGRQIDALRRLSQAHARANLRLEVSREDIQAAYDILSHSLKQAGLNPETGGVDINYLSTGGATNSKTMRRERLLSFLMTEQRKKRDDGRRGVPHEELWTEFKGSFDNELEFERMIEKLKAEGALYEPTAGYYQTT